MLRRIVICLALVCNLLIFSSIAAFAQTDTPVTKDIQNGLCAGSNLQVTDNATQSQSDSACNSSQSGVVRVNDILRHLVNLLSAVVGVVAVIMIIIGGFRYITSGGNDTSITGAKNTILYAIIGLIIVALAQVIVHFVLSKIVNS